MRENSGNRSAAHREPEGIARSSRRRATTELYAERRLWLPQQRRARHDDHRRSVDRRSPSHVSIRSFGRAVPRLACARRSSAVFAPRFSAWALNLDSELLFTGDAGITEPSAASQRRGVDVRELLSSDALVGDRRRRLLRARAFAGVETDESHIPGALENVVAAGLTLNPDAHGLSSSMRLRHFGSYPLIEDNSLRAHASDLVNADVGYELKRGTRMQVSVLNLFNGTADDIQYAYASRLKGETSDGVDDVHFHPAEPRQVRLSVLYRF